VKVGFAQRAGLLGSLSRWFPAVVACTLAWLGAASSASAYELQEHLQTARLAYLSVCEELLSRNAPALDALQRRRLREIACEHASSRAIHYGQYVALSGDHLSEEAAGNLKGDLDAESLVTYLDLAVHDADHFFPGNLRQYEEKHDRALDLAVAAAALGAEGEAWLQVRVQFWVGFYAAAYADHFLQDSFAAGHGSFNRAASTPAASRKFHNTLNEEGVVLRDATGRTWISFGDGLLNLHTDGETPCVEPDPEGEGRLRQSVHPVHGADHRAVGHNRGAWLVQQATRASIRDFLLTFITGVRSPPRERAVVLRLPTECLGSKSEGCSPDATIEQRKAADTSPVFARLARCTEAVALEAELKKRQAELEGCWAPTSSPAPGAPLARPPDCAKQTDALEASLQELRKNYGNELESMDKRGEWAPLLGAMDPARLAFDGALETVYLARLAPTDQLLAGLLSFRSYDLLLWGPLLGAYTHIGDGGPSDRGLVGGITLGLPLGLKYGSVLSWEAVFRPLLYVPLDGPHRSVHVSFPIGLQLGVQVLDLTLALSVAYAGNYAFEFEPGARSLGWANGIETALAVRFAFGLTGGGYKSAPPF
jgi:hypothetical protein